jgi:multidrug efflux system membrane fusion protein
VVRRSRWRPWLAGLILLLLAGALAWHYRGKPATAPAGQAGGGQSGRAGQTPPQLVGSIQADKGDIRIILNELGTVTPLATVTVKTQISGQFTQIGFQEGQLVNKGDFLAQIDPRPYQVTLQQATGQLAHDQGLLDQAQTDLRRYQTLGRQDSISQQQVDDQKFVVAQYAGTVAADQAMVNNANLNLTYCHIVAPVAGQVGLRQVDPGNYVQVSDANGIVVITQMQPISVIFSVPEDNLPDIISRLRGGATLSVEAYDRANVRLLATGQLTTLDNQIDTTTGMLKLRASFANPDELLYPNQFVNARLLVNTLTDVVRVPTAAVQRGEPGTYVYVINANNTVSVRPVKLGPTDGGMVQVTSGLQAGEKVVTDGTDRLRDGAPVQVAPPKPAGQGAASGAATGAATGAAPGAATGAATGAVPGAVPGVAPAAAPGAAPTGTAPATGQGTGQGQGQGQAQGSGQGQGQGHARGEGHGQRPQGTTTGTTTGTAGDSAPPPAAQTTPPSPAK